MDRPYSRSSSPFQRSTSTRGQRPRPRAFVVETIPEVMSTPLSHEIRLAVADADIDVQDHVNNVVYLRWVQDVAIAHWEALATDAMRANTFWVVRRHELEYLFPALPGDEIIARTWVGAATAATFERHTEIRRAADRKLLAKARSVWCVLDPGSGRPRRIDKELRERFAAGEKGPRNTRKDAEERPENQGAESRNQGLFPSSFCLFLSRLFACFAGPPSTLLEHHPRRVASARAEDPAAGVRAGAGQEQAGDGRRVGGQLR